MSLVNETLDLWREAERLLDSLPPTSPDHESVALTVYALRKQYARLTATEARVLRLYSGDV